MSKNHQKVRGHKNICTRPNFGVCITLYEQHVGKNVMRQTGELAYGARVIEKRLKKLTQFEKYPYQFTVSVKRITDNTAPNHAEIVERRLLRVFKMRRKLYDFQAYVSCIRN
ncbi:unnamed protein product [Ceratitis capitata]|uniref:(Mediterranean fruit fly) hypothetical protein n=1 Tax=Ceratitis capitata TaxID=7213 RepID=A0A811VAG2_CERCA|nr:unnamed protein product [Ceratitis capitata]